jgi:hypothetical protein
VTEGVDVGDADDVAEGEGDTEVEEPLLFMVSVIA